MYHARPIITIPPELFPIIASFLPLRSSPHTLRSLALGNRHLYDIVRPLLYSRLILRKEEDAVTVLQRILDEPPLGLAVTEIYIMSDLPLISGEERKPFDVLDGLQILVTKQLIPGLSVLYIHLLEGWNFEYGKDNQWHISRERSTPDFWSSLCNEYPRLRTLVLRNVGHVFKPFIDQISLIQGLSTLRLESQDTELGVLPPHDILKIFNNLPQIASSLHTLSLKNDRQDRQDATLIFSLHFPNLKWLRFQCFSYIKISDSMQFFGRHSQLENISILDSTTPWFYNVKEGFLPNLKHLKASPDDVAALVLVLPQLVSLSFSKSLNGQVPYVLRVILPYGLPELKSLEIEHHPTSLGDFHGESAVWYESLDGYSCIETDPRKTACKDFMSGYMHSIVRATPNIEELGLHGMLELSSADLATLGPTLSELRNMKRFYYRGFPKYKYRRLRESHEAALADFLSSASELARLCPQLQTITNISSRDLPYITAKVGRNSTGDVTGVVQSDGVGMLVSAHEDDPFPQNPRLMFHVH